MASFNIPERRRGKGHGKSKRATQIEAGNQGLCLSFPCAAESAHLKLLQFPHCGPACFPLPSSPAPRLQTWTPQRLLGPWPGEAPQPPPPISLPAEPCLQAHKASGGQIILSEQNLPRLIPAAVWNPSESKVPTEALPSRGWRRCVPGVRVSKQVAPRAPAGLWQLQRESQHALG